MANRHQTFEELRVYRLSEALADAIWRIVVEWDDLAKDTVGKQLIRAADSIGARIAEGCGRWSSQERRRFVLDTQGSLDETRHWLRRAFRRNLLTEVQIRIIKPLLDDLPPTLDEYLDSIGRNDQQFRHETEDIDQADETVPELDATPDDQRPMTNNQ